MCSPVTKYIASIHITFGPIMYIPDLLQLATYQNNSNNFLEVNVMITITITFGQNKNDYNYSYFKVGKIQLLKIFR